MKEHSFINSSVYTAENIFVTKNEFYVRNVYKKFSEELSYKYEWKKKNLIILYLELQNGRRL